MSGRRFKFDSIHEQAILTVGFLGAIALAALVFLLSNQAIPRNGIEFAVELLSVCSGLSAITVTAALFAQIFEYRTTKAKMRMFLMVYFLTGGTFATFIEGLVQVVIFFDPGFGTTLHIILLVIFGLVAFVTLSSIRSR